MAQNFVDGLLCHFAIGRIFSASDKSYAVLFCPNRVFSTGFALRLRAIVKQRTNSRIAAQNITAVDLGAWKILFYNLEQISHILGFGADLGGI